MYLFPEPQADPTDLSLASYVVFHYRIYLKKKKKNLVFHVLQFWASCLISATPLLIPPTQKTFKHLLRVLSHVGYTNTVT